jgi:hypothetical protein
MAFLAFWARSNGAARLMAHHRPMATAFQSRNRRLPQCAGGRRGPAPRAAISCRLRGAAAEASWLGCVRPSAAQADGAAIDAGAIRDAPFQAMESL